MRMTGTTVLAVLATALTMGGAFASDVLTVSTSTAPVAAVPVHDVPAYDWSGFYAGIFTGVQTGADRGTQYGLGVGAGVNLAFDFYLVGAEVTVQGLAGDVGESSYGQILGRAGLIVNDDVAIYAAGGYGIDLGAPDAEDYLMGAGVELMLNDSVSFRAQYLHGFPATTDGEDRNQFTLGASYHF
jgi:outer membrane immunogenic protein